MLVTTGPGGKENSNVAEQETVSTILGEQDLLRQRLIQNYWIQKLSGQPHKTVPRPLSSNSHQIVNAHAWTQVQHTLTPDLYRRIQAACRDSKLGVFIFVVSSLVGVLHRYTGDDDIIVGSPAFKKDEDDSETILLLRFNVSADATGRELIAASRKVILEAYNRQDFKRDLLDEVFGQRNKALRDLFGVVAVDKEIQRPVEAVDEFPLKLELLRNNDGMTLSLSCRTGLYAEWMLTSFSQHLVNFMDSLLKDPAAFSCRLDILPAEERFRLVHEFTRTSRPYSHNLTVSHLFEAQAKETPDRIAVVCGEAKLTYRELSERTRLLAQGLQRAGIRTDDVVAILMGRSVDMVVAIFGILRVGGAFLPLEIGDPHERHLQLVRDNIARMVLTDLDPSERGRFNCQTQTISELCEGQDTSTLGPGPGPTDLAYVIYSSGSGGKPKAIMIEHGSLTDFAEWAVQEYGHDKGLRTLFANWFGFDASILQIIPPLIAGGSVHIVAPELRLDIPAYMSYIRDQRINCIDELPRLIENFFSYVDADAGPSFPDLTTLSLGSESVPIDLVRQCRKYLIPTGKIINAYGPSETTPLITTYAFDGGSESEVSLIGKPRQNTKVFILDRHDELCPIGVAGELCVSGKGLARGYFGNEALVAEKFVPNPFLPGERMFKTGDLARWLPDGNLEFLGRLDHELKIRGARVTLGEIERALEQHEFVKSAAVVPHQDKANVTSLTAYVVSQREVVSTSINLRQFLEERLPSYMIPASFVWLSEFPLTASGKVDRQALLSMKPLPDRPREGEQSQAETTAENVLSEIWAGVLGLEQVGMNENFFELGGDSILSIQIIARARQAGLELTPKQLFQNQSVRELAAVAKQIQKAEQRKVQRTRRSTCEAPVTLTPIQLWFFAQKWIAPQHFNQATLLQVPADFQSELLKSVLTHIEDEHPALRLRFINHDGVWRQYVINRGSAPLPYCCFDVSALSQEEQRRAISETAESLQASLDLTDGPIWRCAHFRCGDGGPGRLLIIVHHLAIDGVSWRVLLEDLQEGYEQVAAGRELDLMPEITSYEEWAETLAEYAATDQPRADGRYWLSDLSGSDYLRLPVDEIADADTNVVRTTHTVRGRLGQSETKALLSRVPETYGTRITEVLVAALVGVLGHWTGPGALLVDLEGHGRGELVTDVDVTRTVGWFTTCYPLRFELMPDASSNPAEMDEATIVAVLKHVKEQMRRVSSGGLPFGILRYLSPSLVEADHLAQLEEQVEVSFNYLGQFDQVVGGLINEANENSGATQDARELRKYLLEVNALVLGGQLRIGWNYSEAIHRGERIEELMNNYLKWLEKLIAHCETEGAGGYTPSDFPLVSLSQEQIDKLHATFDKVRR